MHELGFSLILLDKILLEYIAFIRIFIRIVEYLYVNSRKKIFAKDRNKLSYLYFYNFLNTFFNTINDSLFLISENRSN